MHGKKSKNQFERYFWDQYTHYIEQAKKAIQLLSEMKEKPDSLLCHGDFNQHNIVRGPDGFCIINYESMSCNLQIADLANFLRKILEKNHWNPEIGMRLICQRENNFQGRETDAFGNTFVSGKILENL